MAKIIRVRAFLRGISCVGIVGLVLTGCTANAAQTQHQRVAHEKAACKLVNEVPKYPKPTHSKKVVIEINDSLISALKISENAPLRNVARDLMSGAEKESKTGNDSEIVKALDKGKAICRKLGE